jgi:excisionase family DNA binding protein
MSTAETTPEYLSPNEAARELRVGVRHIHAALKSRELLAARIGVHRRIARRDLQQWFDNLKNEE